jgi:hypothetical protein
MDASKSTNGKDLTRIDLSFLVILFFILGMLVVGFIVH